jgi:enamine deaminase RidA (YjgF/YER057c/UK114 family)
MGEPGLNGLARCQRETNRMLDRAQRLLQENQATYTDVARTWIYLADILDWYPEFNDVRNVKYGEWGLMPDPKSAAAAEIRLPASTGIRGDNPTGAACTMDLLAISAPPHLRPKILQMTNHRQKDAFQYGRAFSRGACIQEVDQTSVHISGTAAIDERGQSLFADDMVAQTRRTLENIDALLDPVGINFGQIATATVFVKRRQDTELFRQVLAERGHQDLPAVCVIADVCRPELLFEMDAVLALPLHL